MPPRGAVHELHPALVVDDQHAFDHAAEDGLHAGAIGLELGRPAADLPHRVVEHARHGADLVGAVVARRPRQIPGRVALRDGGNRAQPPAQERRRRPGQGQRREQRRPPKAISAIRRTAASCSLMLGERQRQPHVGEQRRVGVAHRHRDVEHVGRQRGAVAARDAEAAGCATAESPGGRAWFSRACSSSRVELGVADHGAVRRDERDARADQPAEGIRLGVELRGRRGAAVRSVSAASRASSTSERSICAVHRLPHRPRHQRASPRSASAPPRRAS